MVRYRLNDQALTADALSTAWQVLTEPSEQDRVRRERGPLAEVAAIDLADDWLGLL